MFWWIVLTVVLIAFASFLALAASYKPPKKSLEDYWNEERSKPEPIIQKYNQDIGIFDDSEEVEKARLQKARLESRDRFYKELLRGLPVTLCRSGGNGAAISIDEKSNEIIMLDYKIETEGHIVIDHKCISAKNIIKIDVIQLKKTTTVPVESYVPVVTTKKKSALGRAAVGAVVLGPVGAIVGAVSAVPATNITENKKVISMEQREIDGDIVLSIWEKGNLTSPKKFIFSNTDAALAVKYHIESLNT
ncbi:MULTISPECIES: hypothetical protein [unclassified Brevundimonas]|uniref:hypothetical protein n=1 Tax=unclassified Brevundimonas TaxID=2622653 RepID=UPI0025BEDFAC|nr:MULTISPECIES: hypothetical protein [unclassified Brevundimonas]